MAPSLESAARLVSRQYIGGYPYNYNCDVNGYCTSNWSRWGRWVFLGCIIAAAILFFFLIGCITSRRRRRAGQRPFYGTGWMAANNGNSGGTQYYGGAPQQQYSNYGGYNQSAPPQYNQPTGNSTAGYYGGQQNGVELQQPTQAYTGNVYNPPQGPPPGKY